MIAVVTWSGQSIAQQFQSAEAELMPPFEESVRFLSPKSTIAQHWLWLQFASGSSGRPAARMRMDIGPIFRGIGNFLRRQGVAVEERRRPNGKKTAGISATFRPLTEWSPVSFQVGDGSLEPFDAFYNDGLRWALVWPVRRFTLRFEGGEESEFGSYGIAGAQWKDPERKIAVGLGFPMRLRNADGEFGVIVQLRMKVF
jgi:hypothetical protein